MDLQFLCESCSNMYSSDEKSCPFCDWPSPMAAKKRGVSNILCPKCKFQNDLSNDVCVACQSSLFQKQNNNEDKIKCQHCGMMIKKMMIESHTTDCFLSMEIIKQHQKEQAALKELEDYNKSMIVCKYCTISFPKDLLADHNEVCVSKPKPIIKKPPVHPVKPYLPYMGGIKPHPAPVVPAPVNEPYQQIPVQDVDEHQLFEEDEIKRLSKLQKNAIMYMQSKSKRDHAKAQKQLQAKANRLGFKKQDIENLLFYIQNHAPIIIHVHITKHMEFFVKDTHYRNQFQTGKSSGSLSRQSRTQWEDRMFDKRYSTATDHERVKYGVINFTNDPKGVNCASSYGLSYFLLKQHVRNRCTMTDMDSSSATSLIGTFKYCFHILNKMNDPQLKSAFNAAKALEQSSSVTTTYKQIQIHGPIQFAKDIQRLYVNKKEVQDKKFLDMVYLFCEKNKVEYEFF